MRQVMMGNATSIFLGTFLEIRVKNVHDVPGHGL